MGLTIDSSNAFYDGPAGHTISAGVFGLLRWNIREKRIEMRPNLTPDSTGRCYVTFGGSGSSAQTHKKCVQNLLRFVRDYGVLEQWQADNIHEINRDLWGAAIRLWGLPVWSEEGDFVWREEGDFGYK